MRHVTKNVSTCKFFYKRNPRTYDRTKIAPFRKKTDKYIPGQGFSRAGTRAVKQTGALRIPRILFVYEKSASLNQLSNFSVPLFGNNREISGAKISKKKVSHILMAAAINNDKQGRILEKSRF